MIGPTAWTDWLDLLTPYAVLLPAACSVPGPGHVRGRSMWSAPSCTPTDMAFISPRIRLDEWRPDPRHTCGTRSWATTSGTPAGPLCSRLSPLSWPSAPFLEAFFRTCSPCWSAPQPPRTRWKVQPSRSRSRQVPSLWCGEPTPPGSSPHGRQWPGVADSCRVRSEDWRVPRNRRSLGRAVLPTLAPAPRAKTFAATTGRWVGHVTVARSAKRPSDHRVPVVRLGAGERAVDAGATTGQVVTPGFISSPELVAPRGRTNQPGGMGFDDSGLPAAAARAHHLPGLAGRRPDRQRDLRPDAAALRRGPATRTSTSTSTHPVDRSRPAWRSTTPCSTSPTTSPRSAMGLAASMGQFLLCAGAAGKRYRPAARADHDAPAVGWHRRARRRTSRSRPSRCSTPRRRWPSSSPCTPARPSSRSSRDSDRDRWFTGESRSEYGSSTMWSRAPTRSQRGRRVA